MDLNIKLNLLDQVYKIYDNFAERLEIACKKYCSYCCTRNVVMTTLEGFKIISSLNSSGKTALFENIESARSKKRFQPKTTINSLASICAKGEDIPDENSDHLWGECPLLHDGQCSVYHVRPFGCRCFVSKTDCTKEGYAEVDPFIVTVNNLFLQYIEHIDSDGYSGNLTDVLGFMEVDENRQHYRKNILDNPGKELISNMAIEYLPIPPEHRVKIQPVLQSLQHMTIPSNIDGSDASGKSRL